jgi:hypothetical protein
VTRHAPAGARDTVRAGYETLNSPCPREAFAKGVF